MDPAGKQTLDVLDDFSRSFADRLFSAAPALRDHARSENGLLQIDLEPGRPDRPDCAFWIRTDAEEITVGFGMFHTHFDWPVRDADAESDPIGFIRSLMADETLVEDWTLDGEWSGSSTLAANEEPDLREMVPGHVVYIRSWSGHRDRTIRRR